MTNEQINYILSVEHYLYAYRKTLVMRMPNDEQLKLKQIYFDVMGSHIPNCSTCFIDSFTSLIIRANALKAEQIPTLDTIQQQAIELAQIADDEHRPKRKKK